MTPHQNSGYVGRFAPSPSGPLHFGSLVAALASFLQARAHRGDWLLRIEDIDPPREVPGAAISIQSTLQSHGLHWDGDVLFQSQHSPAYEETLSHLQQKNKIYFCDCTRRQINAIGGRYLGHCRNRNLAPSENHAIRFLNLNQSETLHDAVLGRLNSVNTKAKTEDFVLKRRDGLYSYHLAVVTDDIQQGVTEIVRGSDLLETSHQHMALYRALGEPIPEYVHIPVASTSQGKKLSKQNHARPIEDTHASENLYRALAFLNQSPEIKLRKAAVKDIIEWAIEHWQLSKVPKKREIVLSD